MTKDEGLRLALEVLKAAYVPVDLDKQREKAITAIKAALEAKDEPKDGGWTHERIAGMERLKAQQDSRFEPQRPWVGLTDEEIWEWFRDNTALTNESGIRIVRAIEAKLKEKNT